MTARSATRSRLSAWSFGSSILALLPSSATAKKRGGSEGVPSTTGHPINSVNGIRTVANADKLVIRDVRDGGTTRAWPLHLRPLGRTVASVPGTAGVADMSRCIDSGHDAAILPWRRTYNVLKPIPMTTSGFRGMVGPGVPASRRVLSAQKPKEFAPGRRVPARSRRR